LSNYTPLSSFSFSDQAAAGMSSHNFYLEENMAGGSENRLGLDEAGVEEIRRIMQVWFVYLIDNRAIDRVTFDQARLIRHNRILAKNGIAPDGGYNLDCANW